MLDRHIRQNMLIYTRVIMALVIVILGMAILTDIFASFLAPVFLLAIPIPLILLWLSWTNFKDAEKCANEWAPEDKRNQPLLSWQ